MGENELYIQALSCITPRSSDDMARILDRVEPDRGGLVVFPEYFVVGPDGGYSGTTLEDEKLGMVLNFSGSTGIHAVCGMIELDNGCKYISGLLIGPDGVIGRQRKKVPTSFEMKSGIVPSGEQFKIFRSSRLGLTLSIAMCIDIFASDLDLRRLSSEVLVNPRGFDLDDDRFGCFSGSWLQQLQNLAMMGKRVVVGATGVAGRPGPMAEIIDCEGNILDRDLGGERVVGATISLIGQRQYRRGETKSKIVPRFTLAHENI